MIEFTTLIFSLLAGFLLGLFFFGGLWWTVNKGIDSPRIALWLSLSLLLRSGVLLLGIYYVGNSSWQRMLSCLLGLLIARVVIVRSTRERRRLT